MGQSTSVKLVIPSHVRLSDLVHAAAEKMAEVAGFDDDDALNVGLAVRETVVNAITHGNANDPDRHVTIRLDATDDGAWVPIDGTYDLGPGPQDTPAGQEYRYKLSECMSCGCCLEACPQFHLRPDEPSWDTAFIGAP